MYVMNEDGTAAVNLDIAVAVCFGTNDQNGEQVLLAQVVQGGTIANFPLASGEDRPQRALEAVLKGLKTSVKVLDLNEILGRRSELMIARAITPPNGGPDPRHRTP